MTGEELNKFEAQEQVKRFKRSIDTDIDVKAEYDLLLKEGKLDKIISYSDYYNFRTYPEPTDPVSNSARKKRSIQYPNRGNILITNSTNPDVIGHDGIYLGDGTILSIEGYGQNPSVKTIFQWMVERNSRRDKWTKIYRPNSHYQPVKAMQWGINNIRGNSLSYGISGSTLALNPTYCSKIVFQCYWFANNGNGMLLPSLVSPYALLNVFLNYGRAEHVATWTWRNIA